MYLIYTIPQRNVTMHILYNLESNNPCPCFLRASVHRFSWGRWLGPLVLLAILFTGKGNVKYMNGKVAETSRRESQMDLLTPVHRPRD